MTETVCSNCGKKHTTKRKFCESCGKDLVITSQEKESPSAKEKKDSEKEIKRQVISPEDWEEHRKSIEGEKTHVKPDTRQVFCPNCGKAHKSESKFCQFCGNDLEAVILKFKQKSLPIKYDLVEEKAPPRKPGTGLLILLYIVSVLLVSVMSFFIFGRGLHTIWAYMLGGVFLIFFIITNAFVPRRRGCYGGSHYGSSRCYCPSSSSRASGDCSACQDCGACGGACQGCGDCGDCVGGCGDCGDCGGCDCNYGGLGFIFGLIYVLFSKNKKKE